MKKASLLLYLSLGFLWFTGSCNQRTTTEEKLSVEERMAKARAAKAEKKGAKSAGHQDGNAETSRMLKATPADYRAPVDKVLKGPNGEAVHLGERGAKYYINKNGNKTYLSSNR